MAEISRVLRTADDAMLEQIRREADAYLSAQLTVALASNQRAMTFFGFLATAVSVLASASVTALVSQHKAAPVGWIGLTVSAGLMAAMFFVNLAALPAKFQYVGNSPKSWVGDVSNKRPLKSANAESLEYDAVNIEENRLILLAAARYTKIATWITWSCLASGALGAACLVWFLHR